MLGRLEKLREKNAPVQIHLVSDPAFSPYGTLWQDFDVTELNECARRLYTLDEGTSYEASNGELESLSVAREISKQLFGEFPIQIGCCWGYNSRLNGMEYHRSSEIISAATDLVLMLGQVRDITREGYWDSSQAELFYCPEGTLLELYGTTLHLAPCRVDADPFKAVIILPKGTNTPLEDGTDGTRWMKNKWMLAHPEGPAAGKGAAVRITGENRMVTPLD